VVRAGPKVREGRLRIFGNQFTQDNVIRRQFREGALPGDPLNIEELQAARNRLAGLKYFAMVQYGDGLNPWGLVRDPATPEPDIYDVELEVEESDTRQFTFGAGVSTDGGASASVAVTWRNFDIGKTPDSPFGVFDVDAFRGGGQAFSISAAPGTVYSTFAVSFSDPALRDSRWSFATNLYRRIALYDSYTQAADGVNLRVGRFLDQAYVWHLSLEWELADVTISDPDPDAPLNALDGQGSSLEHGITVTLRRARRRDIDPFLNGHVSTFSASLLGGPFGAEVNVVALEFEHRAGWRAIPTKGGGWHRIGTIVSVDWATAFDDTPEVPIFERYFLGGRNLRGFEFREVGPRSNGSPQGGEFMVTWSTQYTIPLTSRESSGFALDLVFFVDQGNLSVEASEFTFDEWRLSVGFGFAIGLPGGANQPPLLLDFGFALLAEDADKEQIISVNLERNF
jgi:outer membrane protein insertion porin family